MKFSNYSFLYNLKEAPIKLNLNIGRKDFCTLLRERRIFENGNTPFQEFLDKGYFICRKTTRGSGSTLYPYTLVTYKGLVWLRKTLNDFETWQTTIAA
ncbi:MAG: phage antirepressor KilAC domain-containing protein [Chitinophagaceae bacterium]